ncbi:DoxX family protein [Melittangium boletus]|uniref:DoxX family protein n=1 Tax=Melittangium boletus DSM 14713 TaxID=1294270 RepID=A0A250I6X9_9BACT|nr:DoxX family protein [Melittangium boletus]ATB27619.1 hypothetical protein MEBOL_001063 [Melittangium boletus DSM 14713]
MNATSVRAPPSVPASRALHIALWVAQVLVAFAFFMAGTAKLTQPIDELAKTMSWITPSSGPLVRFIGLSEVAGALGLLLPSITRILPVLTGLAGVGCTTIMVLAAGVHLSRGEYSGLTAPIVLGGLSAFIAWGRLKKAPIPPRA